MTRHAHFITLALLIVAMRSSHVTLSQDESPAPPPTITYLEPPSDDERQIVEWAVQRYRDVGLQLPDLQISFPVTCGGKAGRYLVGQSTVEMCRPTRKLALHEFAHAWDDNASIDRRAFLEYRGLDHWYEQPGERSNLTGGEQLALVVTWGLMHVDITASSSESPGQPRDKQPRYLPGLDDSSPKTLIELFVMLTGAMPLSPGAVVSTDTT